MAGCKFSASTPKKKISFPTAQNFLIFDKTTCTTNSFPGLQCEDEARHEEAHSRTQSLLTHGVARAPCRAPLTARKKGCGYENGGSPGLGRSRDDKKWQYFTATRQGVASIL
jgi:hypothetical protein